MNRFIFFEHNLYLCMSTRFHLSLIYKTMLSIFDLLKCLAEHFFNKFPNKYCKIIFIFSHFLMYNQTFDFWSLSHSTKTIFSSFQAKRNSFSNDTIKYINTSIFHIQISSFVFIIKVMIDSHQKHNVTKCEPHLKGYLFFAFCKHNHSLSFQQLSCISHVLLKKLNKY